MTTPPRRLNSAETEAYDRCCDRLAGFDPRFSYEYVDGQLAALAAGPRPLLPEAWLPALFGDTFERTFADPEDAAQALRALQARLTVLSSQLDPEALFEQPDQLRLDPYCEDWTAEARQSLVDEGHLSADDAALLQVGSDWFQGFLDAVDALPQLWEPPADEEAAEMFGLAFEHIAATLLPPDSEEAKAHAAEHYAKGPPTREDLLVEACLSVQDLRMFWVDFAPVTATRRVDPSPGRNDPCPCGSGKKYKKCHGA
jgi:uncharacterized protein